MDRDEIYINYTERPIGVSIFAVLYFIGGFVFLISGTIILLFGVESVQKLNKLSVIIHIPQASGIIIIIGILIIGISILYFLIGYNLLKLKNWARITVIVLNILKAIYFFITLIYSSKILSQTTIPFTTSLIGFAVSVGIIIYFNLVIVRNIFIDNSLECSRRRDQNDDGYKHWDRKFPNAYYVKIINGNNLGKLFYLVEGSNYIGRSSECSIRLIDSQKFVSRHHAVIIIKGERAMIQNLSKKNSTYLNSNPISKSFLRKHDKIKIANYTLEFI